MNDTVILSPVDLFLNKELISTQATTFSRLTPSG
jgi:hypothetical protein